MGFWLSDRLHALHAKYLGSVTQNSLQGKESWLTVEHLLCMQRVPDSVILECLPVWLSPGEIRQSIN